MSSGPTQVVGATTMLVVSRTRRGHGYAADTAGAARRGNRVAATSGPDPGRIVHMGRPSRTISDRVRGPIEDVHRALRSGGFRLASSDGAADCSESIGATPWTRERNGASRRPLVRTAGICEVAARGRRGDPGLGRAAAYGVVCRRAALRARPRGWLWRELAQSIAGSRREVTSRADSFQEWRRKFALPDAVDRPAGNPGRAGTIVLLDAISADDPLI